MCLIQVVLLKRLGQQAPKSAQFDAFTAYPR
jgi:hypothetical protein